MKKIKEDWPVYLIALTVLLVISKESVEGLQNNKRFVFTDTIPEFWVAPSLYTDNILKGEERLLVIYGEDIITNTSWYFGPAGSIRRTTNGMNCQNCHLNAGTQPWGNNYGGVFSTYPKYRDRSASIETISKRVNDCFERSLNGESIDTSSKEMRAIIAYMNWLGKNVKKGTKPIGSGITDLPYMNRAASPQNGKLVYITKCQRCHGNNGEGQKNATDVGYTYPPLWGAHSYNSGAGLFRLSRFAGYVKDNMPFKESTHKAPSLTDEEAWDVAAFVNSQIRPQKIIVTDWPDISKKPIDHPFGPYTDGFSELQHKYGPFQPIADTRKKLKEHKEKIAVSVAKQ